MPRPNCPKTLEQYGRLAKKGKWLCGVVYLPPENSGYPVENPYGEIDMRCGNCLSINCSSVLIFGDLNSRSKHLQDYVTPDNEEFENKILMCRIYLMNCNLNSRVLKKIAILDCIDRRK